MGTITSAIRCAAATARLMLLLVIPYNLAGCSQALHPDSGTQPQSPSSPSIFGSLIGSSAADDRKDDRPAQTAGKEPSHTAGGTPIIYNGGSSKSAGLTNNESKPGFSRAAFASEETISDGISLGAGDTVSVNFENAEIKTVAKAIFGDILNANYTIDPRVTGTISLSTRRPLKKQQLLWLVETALKAQGAIIVHQGDLYRIAPAQDANAAGDVTVGPDRRSTGFGITVLPLENISADTLNKILEGFGAPPGSVHLDASRNLLITRGTAGEREWIVETALAFDVDWMKRQSVGIFPVKNGAPEAIITELSQVADLSIVKFQPIARMNAVMAVANNPRVINQIAVWIDRLDRENAYGPRAHVYRVKYGDAKKLAGVLKEIFVGGGSSSGALADQVAPGNSLVTASAGPTPQASTSTDTKKAAITPSDSRSVDQDQSGDSSLGGAKIRITADVSGNVVIVYASQKDYPKIERTLIELDRPPLQVAVEATVAEVTLNDSLNFGVQYFLNNKLGGVTQVTPASTSPLSQTSSAIGQALPAFTAFLGSATTPKVVLNALHDVTNVKVLSSPSLVVIDNQPAILQVGDQVPVTTGSAAVLTTGSPIVNTYNYIDTGVILRVTPHIHRGSDVRLDIEQEVSQVDQSSNTGTLTPTISQRKMKSSVSVGDGQTLLLAGLISQQRTTEKSGIPGLVDIPMLGNLTSNTSNGATRTELIVFVKAQLIRNGNDARQVAEDLRKRMPTLSAW
ncbi:MAG: type II secretion system secretin GspD [Rhodomicrobium sp.]